MVTREVEGRREVLTVVGNHGEALAVFSDEGEAEMFVWVGGAFGDGWRPTESRAGEVLSVLHGPCAGTRTVALDPSPGMSTPETLAPVCLDRERFARCLSDGGRPRLCPESGNGSRPT